MFLIDRILNQITMYRLVLYGLILLAAISLFFGSFGILSYEGLQLLESLVILVCIYFVTNTLFSKIFRVSENNESYLISALILFFILAPIANVTDVFITAFAGFIAMASKYKK